MSRNFGDIAIFPRAEFGVVVARSCVCGCGRGGSGGGCRIRGSV